MERWSGRLSIAVTVTAWASAFVAIRIAIPGFGAFGLTLGRLLVASVALAVAAPLLGGVRRPAINDLPRIAVCGLTGTAGYQCLLNAGERTVAAGTASLLVNTAPIFAAVLASILLGERVPREGRIGLALGFAGVVTMTVAEGTSIRASLGALLVLGAAISFGLFFVLQKPLLARYGGFELTCYSTWAGTALALPLLPALLHDAPHATSHGITAVVYLGVVSSAIGFVSWAHVQSRVPVAAAANSLYLVPFLAIGIGWLTLGETVRPLALGGGLIALTGIFISRRQRSTTQRASRPAAPPARATPSEP
jgi:drug/metabolite transporter (DMT)-like permease